MSETPALPELGTWTLTDERRRQLASEWRERARELERDAAALRRDGDTVGAAECDDAARDYYADADNLELEVTPDG